MSLRLPPFGNLLFAYQNESIRLDNPIYIYLGKDAKAETYRVKKTGTLATYLPLNEDYRVFNWPVSNQKIILTDTDGNNEALVKKFGVHLLNNFNPSVIFIYPLHICLAKELKHG